jgi:HAD superfamily hydrolase (TIGR01509 family)
MSNIKHIVFDLGRVVLQWQPELPFLQLIPDDAERTRFLTDIWNSEMLLRTDLGETWSDVENDLVGRYPEEAALIRAFRKHWHEMVPGEIDGTAEILEELLAADNDVTALTNFAPDTFAEASARCPALRRFRGVTVSGAVRLAKPDPAIYRHHAETFGLDADATLFFDDTPRNVEAARAADWLAEQFVSAEQMRTDLRRHGISGFS